MYQLYRRNDCIGVYRGEGMSSGVEWIVDIGTLQNNMDIALMIPI